MQKFHYVYHTTIKSNRSGKIYHYVGKRTTTNLDDGYVGSGKVIKMMKRKNKESETPIYEFEVVRSILFDTAEEAFECEILLVEAAREKWGRGVCLNIAPGGVGGFDGGENHPFYGRKHTPESRAKMSASRMGEKNHRYGKPSAMKGKKITNPEILAKLSAASRGENNPRYGKPVSEETREKIRKAHLGRKRPESSTKKYTHSIRIAKGQGCWQHYDEIRRVWIENGKPGAVKLSQIMVSLGHPKYNLRRMYEDFKK
ncbi:NUMOD3 domain-containing DNA-binding protein [Shigella flexneri]|uniref:NUMOD3 domain-containing DNA-binding protein n=1 Tax=Shigella flexneri TaxID=623 RepID=UPI003FA746C5